MHLKRLGVVTTLALAFVATGATAANASVPPEPSGWQLIAVSSDGGATTRAKVNSDKAIYQAEVCDTAADGHHAYGKIQYLIGGVWQTFGSASEYNGNGTCAAISLGNQPDGYTPRVMAENMEGSKQVGSIGYDTY